VNASIFNTASQRGTAITYTEGPEPPDKLLAKSVGVVITGIEEDEKRRR
jgi:hypothetical protein